MAPDDEERDARDREWVRRVQDGDAEAFREIVVAYQDSVLAFIRSFLGRSDEAEDVAQEAFVAAYRSIGRFRGDSKLRTWLFSVARFTCLHRIRKRSSDRTVAVDPQAEEYLEVPDLEQGHDALLEREESREMIRRAVEELPEGHRAVILLSHWEGMKYPEIAEALGIPVGTVKSRVHNAMAMLLTKMKPLLGESEEAGA